MILVAYSTPRAGVSGSSRRGGCEVWECKCALMVIIKLAEVFCLTVSDKPLPELAAVDPSTPCYLWNPFTI